MYLSVCDRHASWSIGLSVTVSESSSVPRGSRCTASTPDSSVIAAMDSSEGNCTSTVFASTGSSLNNFEPHLRAFGKANTKFLTLFSIHAHFVYVLYLN